MNNISTKIDWDKINGLIPAIIQDNITSQVLMLGYMNAAALEQTIETGMVTFYSRKKQRLWTKGETSGNNLKLIAAHLDCDNDSLLVLVQPQGPCCHLNTLSCFNIANTNTITNLENVIQQRKRERPTNSYVTALFNSGQQRIAQKVGEEGVEVALAAAVGDKHQMLNELADLLFHSLVLLGFFDLRFVDVLGVLDSRIGTRSP